jgi:GTPase
MFQLKKIRVQSCAYDLPISDHQLPTLVLVGRPNVGKSLLFNRLIQRHEALVADLPGLTRDRLYGIGYLEQQAYLVIDTGGLGGEDKYLDKFIIQQVQEAVQEATHILMVVDAQVGLQHEDQVILQRLRATHKPITLLINKAEGLVPALVASEFYPLGLERLRPVSALQNQGIKAIVEALLFPITTNKMAPINKVNEEKEVDRGGVQSTQINAPPGPCESIKIAIVGRPNVGKSTLVNRLLGKTRSLVTDQPGTTRDSITVGFQHQNEDYILIDTAGIRRSAKIEKGVEQLSVIKSLQAIYASQVVLFLLDAQTGITDQDLHLLRFVLESGRSLVIAVNKWDGLPTAARKQLQTQLNWRLRFVSFVKICFISAREGSGISTIFLPIKAAFKSAIQPMYTGQLTRWLMQALEAHAPPSVGGRQSIKLRYAHPGGYNPPLILIHGRGTKAVPESYRRYLERFYRQVLGSVGTPLRILFKENA